MEGEKTTFLDVAVPGNTPCSVWRDIQRETGSAKASQKLVITRVAQFHVADTCRWLHLAVRLQGRAVVLYVPDDTNLRRSRG